MTSLESNQSVVTFVAPFKEGQKHDKHYQSHYKTPMSKGDWQGEQAKATFLRT